MQTIRGILNEYREAYIQQLQGYWAKDYTEEPKTNWNNIFNNIIGEFESYADDEASTDENGNTIQENYEQGNYSENDIDNLFDMFIMYLDISEYDF